MDTFAELTQHLILYSKMHYKHSGDVVCDLKKFMTNWSGTDIKYYTDYEIYRIVSEAFVESCSKREILELVRGIFMPIYVHRIDVGKLSINDAITSMIGLMACIQIKEDDGTVLVYLPKPNPKYLPVPNKNEKSLAQNKNQ